jgi:hypothetical protein
VKLKCRPILADTSRMTNLQAQVVNRFAAELAELGDG